HTLKTTSLPYASLFRSGVEQPLHEQLHLPLVIRVGCANEIVVGEAEHAQHALELRSILISELLRRYAPCLSRFLHLQPVFIGAGDRKSTRLNSSHVKIS